MTRCAGRRACRRGAAGATGRVARGRRRERRGPFGLTPSASSCACSMQPGAETARVNLPHRTGDVFHAHVPGIGAGQRYGLRAHGPFEPERGLRFNPSKLLVDPYATLHRPAFDLHPAMFGYRAGDPSADLSLDGQDSAPFVPKAIVEAAARAASRPPGRACRGIARSSTSCTCAGSRSCNPAVPPELRGTFAGLGCAASVQYLRGARRHHRRAHACRGMGQRAPSGPAGALERVGLQPHHAARARSEARPRRLAGGSRRRRGPAGGGHRGDRRRRAQPHRRRRRAGADAVPARPRQRHLLPPEAGRAAPLHRRRRLRQHAGAGPAARRCASPWMACAPGWTGPGSTASASTSRRRWAGAPQGFDPAAPLLSAIAQDPVLRELKLIAEPWDIGPGGYQPGNFPPPGASGTIATATT